MSQQQSYQEQPMGFPGQARGSHHRRGSYCNDAGSAKQVSDIVIGTVTDGATYTFTINGYTVTADAPDSGSTKQIIAALLVEAGRQVLELEDLVTFNPSGDDVRVTSRIPGTAFTYADADGKISESVVTANESTQPIKFGRAVVKRTGGNANDQSAMLPSSTGQTFLGVVERIHSDVDATNASNTVRAMSMMTVIEEGDVIVEVEKAVDVGDPVYYRHTAGAGEEVGMFRDDADTSDADAVTGATFRTKTTGRGLAVARFK